MRRLLVLAGLLICTLPASATKYSTESQPTSQAEIRRIEAEIERLGARVIWKRINSGACARRGLLGVYQPDQRSVVMCQQSIRDNTEPLIETLRHEGWHAVQQICNKGRPVMSRKRIFSLLSESDRKNLREFYDRSQYTLEAEARVIEKSPTGHYLLKMNQYCTHR